MWWNDWKFQIHWNILEWVDLKSTTKRVKPFSVSSKKFYINNNDRSSHFVGHSKLTPLDIVEFYERKQTMMIILMKQSHSKLEKKEQQKHTKRK